MTESVLMREIQAACCRDPAVRLFRNNVGNGFVGIDVTPVYAHLLRSTGHGADLTVLKNARRIQFGLGPGTSDLIGGHSVLITPEMLGHHALIFASLEVKSARGRATPEQRRFIEVVKSLGGIADVVRSVEHARDVLTNFPVLTESVARTE